MARKLISAFLLLGAVTGCGGNDIVTSSSGESPSASQTAPVVRGTPATLAKVGEEYSFRPEAENIAPASLAFRINGTPAWASFDPATGTLTGRPEAAHIGTTSDIVITAYDRSAPSRTASLSPFAIRVGQPWMPLPELPVPLREGAAASVGGKIYLFGGWKGGSELSDTIYSLRPGDAEWKVMGNSGSPRFGHAAVVYQDKIYFLGGFRYNGGPFPTPLANFEEYRAEAASLTDLGKPVPEAKGGLAACLVGKRLYAIGGRGAADILSSVHVYDFETSSWTSGPSLNRKREYPQCFALGSRLYVVGGGLNTVEMLDTAAPEPKWQDVSDATAFRGGSVQVVDGLAYLIGGEEGSSAAQVFDPQTGQWGPRKTGMPSGRAYAASFALDGRIWLVGGTQPESPYITKTVHAYEPAFDF